MKVLWLCNVPLPMAAEQFHMEGSNKEGWISGLAGTVLGNQRENGIRLAVAFPVPAHVLPGGVDVSRKTVSAGGASFECYGFLEDVRHAQDYDSALEGRMRKITDEVQPDIVHCFGTEYPHTLAMCRSFPRKERLLVGLQGLCTLIARAYFADLPERVIRSVTLRDLLRRDTLRRQREKFVMRGNMERETVSLAGNITGRTRWDKENSRQWNPDAHYFCMNETLRPEFYGPVWDERGCVPHSIFLSQGDYPLKGLHYMLCAMPVILEKYPDARVYVAGDSLVEYKTLKQRLKISAYGKYLRELIQENGLGGKVEFLGRLNAVQMRDRYLQSSLFVCCSSVENSPNSLGEAMLLGMPCVSANVGGVSSIFTHGKDGILYGGHRPEGARDFQAGLEPGENAGLEPEERAELEPGGETKPEPGGKAAPEIGGKVKPEEKIGPEPEENAELKACQAKRGNSEINNAYHDSEKRMIFIANALAQAVLEMWGQPDKMREYCANARKHAEITHEKDANYQTMLEIYAEINSMDSRNVKERN